ncbi:unnamed protein product [Litomosoides sigmodontis]|uniref:Uncharacterized protein n=1 Tax=Litomosoides sigmodontis TaxID=42156 RepID=A0A3P6SHX6_LITSI|nr:unnamed protein product [Litomosoides sigmodontis]
MYNYINVLTITIIACVGVVITTTSKSGTAEHLVTDWTIIDISKSGSQIAEGQQSKSGELTEEQNRDLSQRFRT